MSLAIFVISASDSAVGNPLLDTVRGFAERLLPFTVTLAAVGALSMALIEAIKKLLDVRTQYQARRWTLLMEASNVAVNDRQVAYAQLLELSTGVARKDALDAASALLSNHGRLPLLHAFRGQAAHAVFAQDCPTMMSLVQDAVDVSLAAPSLYGELFDMMTEGALLADRSTWKAQHIPLSAPPIALPAQAQPVQSLPLAPNARELANVYGRLRQVTKRKLDGFQVYTEDRWASLNQVAANVAGAVIMFAALLSIPIAETTPQWWQLALMSVIGGILSPVAKDLVTALKKAKEA